MIGIFQFPAGVLVSLVIISQVTCEHDITDTVGDSPSARTSNDTHAGVSLITNDANVFSSAGQILSFSFYAYITDVSVRFQVWRPQSGTSFQLVHQTSNVLISDTGVQSYRLPSSDQFTVQAGDTIGLAVVDTSPLTLSSIECSDDTLAPLTGSLSVSTGNSVTFTRAGSECKQFSFRANVIYEGSTVLTQNCTHLVAGTGYADVSSPGYDGVTLYNASLSLCWVITGDFTGKSGTWGVNIQIDNFGFELESEAGDCIGDSLTFIDGDTLFGTLLAEVCGIDPPMQISGTTDSIYIRMYTDDAEIPISRGIGFLAQYRIYQISEEPVQVPIWALILGIFVIILLLVAVGAVVFLWLKLRKQRRHEYLEKLKDGEFKDNDDSDTEDDFERVRRNRSRMASHKVSPMMIRREKSLYNDPKGPEIRVDAHREVSLKEHIPSDRVPQASDYRVFRAKNNSKMKHWSKLGAGITD